MSSFQSLPQHTLDRIIEHYYQREKSYYSPRHYQIYRQLQLWSFLCHKLRRSILPYLDRQLVFERYNLNLETKDPNSNSSSRMVGDPRKKLPPDIVWRNNLQRCIEGGNSERVEEVIISTTDRYPDPEDLLALLRQPRFCSHKYKWEQVKTLGVYLTADYELDDKESTSDGDWFAEESFVNLGAFLNKQLPNVDRLLMDENRCIRVGPRNALSHYIAGRLLKFKRMHLTFAHMPVWGSKTLPATLTHLHLHVYSHYDFIDIPRIITPALICLTLSAIPLNYLWERFASSQTGKVVEFRELKKLHLSFHTPYRSIPSGKTEDDLVWEKYQKDKKAEDTDTSSTTDLVPSYRGNPKLKTISVKETSPKYTVLKMGGRRPRFPKLVDLTLNSYPGKVHEILKDFPLEQLAKLTISGELVAFKGMRIKGQLPRLRKFDLMSYTETKFRDSCHSNRFLEKALSTQSPLITDMRLSVSSKCRVYLPIRDKVTCMGLRELELTAPISYQDIPQLLLSLPSLECLDLQRALFVDPPRGVVAKGHPSMAQHMLQSNLQPVSQTLVKFVPDVLCRHATDEIVFYNVLMLIVRCPQLRELKMFSIYSTQFLRELVPLFKMPELWPHLRHLANLVYAE